MQIVTQEDTLVFDSLRLRLFYHLSSNWRKVVFKNVLHLMHLTCVTSVALLLKKIKKIICWIIAITGTFLLLFLFRLPVFSFFLLFFFVCVCVGGGSVNEKPDRVVTYTERVSCN